MGGGGGVCAHLGFSTHLEQSLLNIHKYKQLCPLQGQAEQTL
jgi:hypothetical protein